jgi:hypothetical protein
MTRAVPGKAAVERIRCRMTTGCPRCGAAPGNKCVGTNGQRRRQGHAERWTAYVQAKAQENKV